MRDVLGKKIGIGDHIMYMKSMADKNFEEAIVTEISDSFIKIEYLGRGSVPKYDSVKKMTAGRKSRLTVTDKRVVVLGHSLSDDKNVFAMERERYKAELDKVRKQLAKSIKREDVLSNQNRILLAEVEKIHDRFDILDL